MARPNLLRLDWDLLEDMIKKELDNRIRTYKYFSYFIIDDETVLVKIFDENNVLVFTVLMKLFGDHFVIAKVE